MLSMADIPPLLAYPTRVCLVISEYLCLKIIGFSRASEFRNWLCFIRIGISFKEEFTQEPK